MCAGKLPFWASRSMSFYACIISCNYHHSRIQNNSVTHQEFPWAGLTLECDGMTLLHEAEIASVVFSFLHCFFPEALG